MAPSSIGFPKVAQVSLSAAGEGIQIADRNGASLDAVLPQLRDHAALLSSLLDELGEQRSDAVRDPPQTSKSRRTEQVQRLLEGSDVDTSDLAYEFSAFHLGAIAMGPRVAEALQDLAAALDCRLLTAVRDERTIWVWFGSRRHPDIDKLQHLAAATELLQILAIGEPAEGLSGWRLTHRQARAALTVALRGSRSFVRYADAALLASMLQDDLLATSLHQLYLAPLESQRDGGKAARQTLRAYFAAGLNSTSAAAALNVDRRTIRYRLRKIEDAIGWPPAGVRSEIELALRLHDASPFPDTSDGAI